MRPRISRPKLRINKPLVKKDNRPIDVRIIEKYMQIFDCSEKEAKHKYYENRIKREKAEV